MRMSAAVLLLMMLSACGGQYGMVETDRRVIGQAYSVEPQLEWNRLTNRNPVNPRGKDTGDNPRRFHSYEIWSINGFRLDSLYLFQGVPDGDPLFLTTESQKRGSPVFRGTMQASEVSEFVVDSLNRLGNNAVEARNLRPAGFGTLPGFRFELAYFSQTGLKFDGMAVGTVNRGVLHMILFTGARSYYFPKYRNVVERLFESIEFIGRTANLSGPLLALGENPKVARLQPRSTATPQEGK